MNDDLISRSELKKSLNFVYDCAYIDSKSKEGVASDIIKEIDNAPTVEYPEQVTIKCDTEDDKQKLLSAFRNANLKVLVEEERPYGEWLYGCLDYSKCSNCNYANHYGDLPFCPNCGADMRGE